MKPPGNLRKTPLSTLHRNAGARMIDFAGWDMPVYYTGILEEHAAVRQNAGLFDISHMGRFEMRGAGAAEALQGMITNNMKKLSPGRALYTLLCDESGGVIDDIIIYQTGADEYFICVNAVNRQIDFEWMTGQSGKTIVVDRSEELAQVAIQGPKAAEFLSAVLGPDSMDLKYFGCRTINRLSAVGGRPTPVLVARTGYTGEDGFELYFPVDLSESLWSALLEAGREKGLQAVGLGARDSLRIEMGYPLYGHEISRDIGPVEAGLMRFVDLQKDSFVGKQALQKRVEKADSKLKGITLKEDGMIREGYEIMAGGRDGSIGRVTSGCYSPGLKRSIGLALLGSNFQGRDVKVKIRNRQVDAEVTDVPFVRPGVKAAK